ncbi:hypothetical protein DFJ73DRAFT_188881 [Zopfochytrium polystomum]|nr:hypothetical protein DFJ73DRAFT_188881 [Zopfochytrium polystomum]
MLGKGNSRPGAGARGREAAMRELEVEENGTYQGGKKKAKAVAVAVAAVRPFLRRRRLGAVVVAHLAPAATASAATGAAVGRRRREPIRYLRRRRRPSSPSTIESTKRERERKRRESLRVGAIACPTSRTTTHLFSSQRPRSYYCPFRENRTQIEGQTQIV